MRLWKRLLETRPPGRLIVVALLTLLAACSALGQMRYVPGRVLVKFRDGVARLPLSPEALAGAMPVGQLGRGEALVLAVPRGANEIATARALRMRPDVEVAEPDYLFEPQAAPNDPQFPSQWHLAKIQAPQAWDLSKGSQQVVIAVIDSGVDPSHPDLQPKLVPGWNVLDGTANWADDYGHGTAVAGTAAAATNNAVGVAGVAWDCRIMPVKAAGSRRVRLLQLPLQRPGLGRRPRGEGRQPQLQGHRQLLRLDGHAVLRLQGRRGDRVRGQRRRPGHDARQPVLPDGRRHRLGRPEDLLVRLRQQRRPRRAGG
jgi:hypothetical protein